MKRNTERFAWSFALRIEFLTNQSETEKAKERNQAYYRKYPEDVMRVKKIMRYIQTENVLLPSGGRLSFLRLRQLGWLLGFHGTMSALHGTI